MKILFIRHGQIRANREGRWHGSTDSPLTLKGKIQARLTWRAIKNHSPTVAFVSPLQRCRKTALLAIRNLNIPTEVLPGLAEMSIGEWENRKYAELNAVENLHSKFKDDLSWCPPNGESLQKVSDRSLAAFDQITDSCSAEDTILVVSHGAILAILLANLLDGDPRGWTDYFFGNCSITKGEFSDHLRIIDFNNTDHLGIFE